MPNRKQYKKRANFHVTAVKIDLSCGGFTYQKWGAEQKCRAGDWLVNNGGDIYTVEKNYFRDNYREIRPGEFEKLGSVWAELAEDDGAIDTLEGRSDYKIGDYLVFDREFGGNAYAVRKQAFENMYELLDPEENLSEQEAEYINLRLTEQINWYDSKANKNRIFYHLWQTLAIFSAAMVPVVSAMEFPGSTQIVAALGGASAVFAGIISLFKMQENWVKFRATCEDLKSHLAQYKVRAGIYVSSKSSFKTLVENCEKIISAERGQWVQQNSSAKLKEEG